MWSYKVDRLTGDVLPVLVDANNHCWDAVRYAIQIEQAGRYKEYAICRERIRQSEGILKRFEDANAAS